MPTRSASKTPDSKENGPQDQSWGPFSYVLAASHRMYDGTPGPKRRLNAGVRAFVHTKRRPEALSTARTPFTVVRTLEERADPANYYPRICAYRSLAIRAR